MFLKIATAVIEIACILIIPKTQHITVVHLFTEQILAEYVLRTRHYSRLWGFDMGDKHMRPPTPTSSIVQSRIVGEMTRNQIVIANY